MFERRLKIVLILWMLPAAVVTARLVQLQIVRADQYRRQAQEMLDSYRRLGYSYFPFVRGDITDRAGRQLATDAPAWDICVRYEVIARDVPDVWDDGDASGKPWSHSRSDGPAGIDDCWAAISKLTGVPVSELLERAGRIKRQVSRIKENVSAGQGVETPIPEEAMAHPVVKGLNHEQQVEAALRLAAYGAVEISASHVRAYVGGPAVGHLLGEMSEVDADDIQNDPLVDDDMARYRPRDMRGVRGAEAVGEQVLRGRRGCVRQDSKGRQIGQPIEPVNGSTVRLSIDYALQQELYERLKAAVEATAFRTGGCAVLLHIPTGQVLAMVDYPSVDPSASARERVELAKDTARQPLLFRAVREYYPPGSTVKPMLLAAALAEGLVTPQTTYTCYGQYSADDPDKLRCTGVHGAIAPVTAIQHSCNVYFYHVGERLGVSRSVDWMTRFGLGRLTGTGLPDERPGRLPTDTSRGSARYVGVGQGRIDVTPLQAANMVATIASGQYRPATIRLDDPEPRPAVDLPIPQDAWQIVHEGMYKAVNEQGGTAYGDARGTLGDQQYVLLGKTGSAEVPIGRTIERLYVLHLPDGRVQEIVAADQAGALAQTDCPPADRDKLKVAGSRSYSRYPPDPPQPYTHAWFVGYLAPRGNHLVPVRSGEAAVAIAVVIEFTGHGGDVAAPVARDMLRSFLSHIRGQALAFRTGGGR